MGDQERRDEGGARQDGRTAGRDEMRWDGTKLDSRRDKTKCERLEARVDDTRAAAQREAADS